MNAAERRRLLHGPPDDDFECVDCGNPSPRALCAACRPTHVHRLTGVAFRELQAPPQKAAP